MRGRELAGPLAQGLVALGLAAAAVAWVSVSAAGVEQGRREETRAQLERAVRRSAVACYALEGVYPPTLSYLEEHYGLQVDAARFTVYYDVFAENLMPEITVLENETE